MVSSNSQRPDRLALMLTSEGYFRRMTLSVASAIVLAALILGVALLMYNLFEYYIGAFVAALALSFPLREARMYLQDQSRTIRAVQPGTSAAAGLLRLLAPVSSHDTTALSLWVLVMAALSHLVDPVFLAVGTASAVASVALLLMIGGGAVFSVSYYSELLSWWRSAIAGLLCCRRKAAFADDEVEVEDDEDDDDDDESAVHEDAGLRVAEAASEQPLAEAEVGADQPAPGDDEAAAAALVSALQGGVTFGEEGELPVVPGALQRADGAAHGETPSLPAAVGGGAPGRVPASAPRRAPAHASSKTEPRPRRAPGSRAAPVTPRNLAHRRLMAPLTGTSIFTTKSDAVDSSTHGTPNAAPGTRPAPPSRAPASVRLAERTTAAASLGGRPRRAGERDGGEAAHSHFQMHGAEMSPSFELADGPAGSHRLSTPDRRPSFLDLTADVVRRISRGEPPFLAPEGGAGAGGALAAAVQGEVRRAARYERTCMTLVVFLLGGLLASTTCVVFAYNAGHDAVSAGKWAERSATTWASKQGLGDAAKTAFRRASEMVVAGAGNATSAPGGTLVRDVTLVLAELGLDVSSLTNATQEQATGNGTAGAAAASAAASGRRPLTERLQQAATLVSRLNVTALQEQVSALNLDVVAASASEYTQGLVAGAAGVLLRVTTLVTDLGFRAMAFAAMLFLFVSAERSPLETALAILPLSSPWKRRNSAGLAQRISQVTVQPFKLAISNAALVFTAACAAGVPAPYLATAAVALGPFVPIVPGFVFWLPWAVAAAASRGLVSSLTFVGGIAVVQLFSGHGEADAQQSALSGYIQGMSAGMGFLLYGVPGTVLGPLLFIVAETLFGLVTLS